MSGPWSGVDASCITAALVKKLLSREIAYVRVPGFLSPDWCARVVRRLLESDPPIYESYEVGLLPYSEKPLVDAQGEAPKMMQVGFALYEAVKQEGKVKAYFERSKEIYGVLRELYSGGEDPLLKAQDMLSRQAGWKILAAEEKGKPYISDMIWVMPHGIPLPLHSDSSENLKPLAVSKYRRQFSCNAYLSAPESGGELVLYRERPKPGSECSDPAELRRRGEAVLSLGAGDLLLFDGGNFHEVLKTSGARPRITNHSAVVFSPEDSTAIFWA